MNRQKSPFRPRMLAMIAQENPDFFVAKENIVFSNINKESRPVLSPVLKVLRTPQYAKLGRLLCVNHDGATIHINMSPFELRTGDVLVIPEYTYFGLTDMSENFSAQVVSFKNLPVSFSRCTLLHLSDMDYVRVGKYLDVLWDLLHKEELAMQTVTYLLSALMSDLLCLHEEQEKHPDCQKNRKEQLLQQFLDLVAEHGNIQRNVGFYAEQLCISPNHFSTLIKQQSGQTVMQWLNTNTILQAKVMLKHSNFQIYEIADRLGFESTTFFSRFFKRETGMTPRDYKKSSGT